MEEKEVEQLKDDILRLVTDKEHGADYIWIYSKLNKEGLTKNYLKKVLEEINDFEINVATLTIGQTYHLERTPKTQRFLDNGGFVNQFDSNLEADIEAAELKRQERRIKRLEERKLKTYWIPIAVSVVGLAIAIASYFRPSENVSKQEIKSIQDNIQQLKKEFDIENKELKERLFKAEMLIAVYEADTLP